MSTASYRAFSLREWNSLVLKGLVTEDDIRHRIHYTMINIECPKCGCHMSEPTDKVVGAVEVPVYCKNCAYRDKRRLALPKPKDDK